MENNTLYYNDTISSEAKKYKERRTIETHEKIQEIKKVAQNINK